MAKMPPFFATQNLSGSAAAASAMLGDELDTTKTLPTSSASSARSRRFNYHSCSTSQAIACSFSGKTQEPYKSALCRRTAA